MDYTFNSLRLHKIKKKYLVTAEHGGWLYLTKKELRQVQKLEIKEGLFKKLEKEGLVLTKDNIKNVALQLRNKNHFLFSGTSLHIVVPTLRCNLKCVYCHASSRAENDNSFDMNKETAKKIVDFIFQSPSHIITIEFQGGEPLLNFDVVKYIVCYAKELNKSYKKELQFDLVSNLYFLNATKLEFLVKNNVNICTSLDGPELLHNKNRPNSYKTTIEGIKKLKEYYKRKKLPDREVNALLTVTKHSLLYWREIIEEYADNKINHIHIRSLNNLGCAQQLWNKVGYTPEKFIKFWKRSIDHIIKLNKKGNNITERGVLIILRKIIDKIDPNYLEMRSPCGAVIGQIVYDYNGNIYTCDEGRMLHNDLFLLGNVKKDSYEEVTGSSKACAVVLASCNDTQICDSCSYKPYCGICPVCNYAEQGSVVAKIPATPRCKIFKAQFDYIFDKIVNDREASRILKRWLSVKKHKIYKSNSLKKL